MHSGKIVETRRNMSYPVKIQTIAFLRKQNLITSCKPTQEDSINAISKKKSRKSNVSTKKSSLKHY
jgi:hypothetical protein